MVPYYILVYYLCIYCILRIQINLCKSSLNWQFILRGWHLFLTTWLMAESHLILLGAEGAYLFLMCGSEFLIKDRDQQHAINPLNPKLNSICYLLALLGAHHFLHVSRIRVKLLTFRLLMSYIYGARILDVSRSHTTQHSR